MESGNGHPGRHRFARGEAADGDGVNNSPTRPPAHRVGPTENRTRDLFKIHDENRRTWGHIEDAGLSGCGPRVEGTSFVPASSLVYPANQRRSPARPPLPVRVRVHPVLPLGSPFRLRSTPARPPSDPARTGLAGNGRWGRYFTQSRWLLPRGSIIIIDRDGLTLVTDERRRTNGRNGTRDRDQEGGGRVDWSARR